MTSESAAPVPLGAAVKTMFRSFFRPPYEVPSIVGINVLLVLSGWFLTAPATIKAYPALVFLPIAMVSWAYADVPATNHFGSDPDRARAVLGDRQRIIHLITVDNLSLWLLISPAMVVLAIVLALSSSVTWIGVAVGLAVMAMPFTYLGLAANVAPLLPFHEMPPRERLRRKDTWLRWGTAVCLAYFVLSLPAAVLSLIPAAIVIALVGDSDAHWVTGMALVVPWSLLLWRIGVHVAARVTVRRREWLAEFLADPSRG